MEERRAEIRVAILREKQLVQGDVELIASWDEAGEEPIWIDIAEPTQADIEPLLEEWFRFHELAAEDALSPATQPKYDRFPRYDFFVFRSIKFELSSHGVGTRKLSAFLGRNFLFTIHAERIAAIQGVWDRLPHDKRMMQRGCDFLLYSILDVMIDAHFPLIDEIEERMDEIHELIFKYPSQFLLDELLELKRDLNIMRRHTLPQRELMNQVSRGDAQFIQPEHLIYFRDLYDHTYRIGESIDVERDLATATMEAYLSVVANRTNDIMKVLTIISTVLLPMNFIAGIYGMNFAHMPELQWVHGYPFAIAMMVIIGGLLMSWFWRKGWLWQTRREVLQRERRIRRALKRKPVAGTVIPDVSYGSHPQSE